MLLVIHVVGAVATFGLGLFFRKLLRAGVLFEFITGTLLAITEGSTLGSYCVKIGFYLAFWFALEAIFIIRKFRGGDVYG